MCTRGTRHGAADKRVRVGGAIRVGWSGDGEIAGRWCARVVRASVSRGHVVNDAAHRVGPWRGRAPTRLQIGPLPPCNRCPN